MNEPTDPTERPAWQAPPPPPPSKRPFWKKKRFFIPAGLLILIVAVAPKGDAKEKKFAGATAEQPSGSKVVGSETQDTAATSTTAAKANEVVRQDLQIVESGFTQLPPNSIGTSYASYAVIVKNPNPTTWVASSVNVNVTFLDAAGAVIGSENDTISFLAPGQTAAVADSDNIAGLAKIEVQALVEDWEKHDETFGAFKAENVRITNDTYGAKVTASLVSSYVKDVKNAEAVAVVRNAAGKILGGSFTYVDFVPAGGRIGVEISSLEKLPGATKAEIYTQPSWLSLIGD